MNTVYVYLALVVLVFSVQKVSAQVETIRYLSKSGIKEVAASDAHFFEIKLENESGGGTRTRYLVEDSSNVSQITYSDFGKKGSATSVKEGFSYQWHRNGTLWVESFYKKDKAEGKSRSWYESGQLKNSMTYKNDQLQDTLTSYYETGELRRFEIHESGRILMGEVYGREGKKLDFFPMQQPPVFPGGEAMLLKWLSKNVNFPKATWKAKAQGTVVMAFTIDKAGRISDIELISGFHPAADAEGFRVINSMPHEWQPGKEEGEPVPVRYTLPINFSLN